MLKLSFNNSCFCFQFHLIKSGVVVRWFLCHLMCFLCFGKCESISGYLTFFSTAGNWSCGGAPEAAKVRYFGKCESFSGYLFFSTVGNCSCADAPEAAKIRFYIMYLWSLLELFTPLFVSLQHLSITQGRYTFRKFQQHVKFSLIWGDFAPGAKFTTKQFNFV